MFLEITKLPIKAILYISFIKQFCVRPNEKNGACNITYRAFTVSTFHLNGTLRWRHFFICRLLLVASPAPVEHTQHSLSRRLFIFSPPFRVIRKQFVNYDFDPMVSGVNRPLKFLHRVIKNNLSKMAAALERETSDRTVRCHTSASAHRDRLR